MTLVVALGCPQYVLQLADRRLTAGQSVVSDESPKALVLLCDNARCVVGFSGIARVGVFETSKWLVERWLEAARADGTIGGVLGRLHPLASSAFRNDKPLRSLHPRDKRLSLLITGFLYTETSPLCIQALVTNFQDVHTGRDSPEAWDAFQLFKTEEIHPRPERFTLVQRIGNWTACQPDDFDALRGMLDERKPPEAVVAKAEIVLRSIAARPAAQGTIGSQIDALVLPSSLNELPRSVYLSGKTTAAAYSPGVVDLRKGGTRIGMLEVEWTAQSAEGSSVVMATSRVHRNAPCPCGSGKRYRDCHRAQLPR